MGEGHRGAEGAGLQPGKISHEHAVVQRSGLPTTSPDTKDSWQQPAQKKPEAFLLQKGVISARVRHGGVLSFTSSPLPAPHKAPNSPPF